MTKLIRYIAAEKEKIRDLDAKKKAAYILHYYWLWIIGIGSGLFFLFYILFHVFFTVKDYWFYGIFANTMANTGNSSDLRRDFTDYAGYDVKQKKVEMNASSYFDPSVKGGTNNSYYQMFVAVTEAEDLDVLVMGTEGLKAVGSSGRLLDLRAESVPWMEEEYARRLIYCYPADNAYSDGPVPVGIDISDSLLVTKYHLYDGDCALGLGAYSSRPESVRIFLDFILEENGWADLSEAYSATKVRSGGL